MRKCWRRCEGCEEVCGVSVGGGEGRCEGKNERVRGGVR